MIQEKRKDCNKFGVFLKGKLPCLTDFALMVGIKQWLIRMSESGLNSESKRTGWSEKQSLNP